MKKEILIIDNFLDEKEIGWLLSYFKDFNNEVEKFRDTNVLQITGQIKPLEEKFNKMAKTHAVDWLQIVEWPENSYQDLHQDDTSKRTTATSITYLNDGFAGGETYFEDGTIIKPRPGRTVFFDGQYYKHGVNKVTEGVRYTVPVWYTKLW